MDSGDAILAAAIGLGLPSLGLLYRLIPRRETNEKGVLKESDIERLDERVELYVRIGKLEEQQTHSRELLERLTTDLKEGSRELFKKVDRLTLIILKRDGKLDE